MTELSLISILKSSLDQQIVILIHHFYFFFIFTAYKEL